MIEIEEEGKTISRQSESTEDHYSVVTEPDGKYLDHLVIEPEQGTGRDIALEIADLIRSNDSVDSLEAIGGDSTVLNTGYRSGIMAEIERNIQKPLQRLVCLKHCNELPL